MASLTRERVGDGVEVLRFDRPAARNALGSAQLAELEAALAALAADDALHDVLLRRCGNAAVVATAERFTPLVRRLERQRFASAHGRDSVVLHDRLIDACEAGDVDRAVAVTTDIWTALLSDLSEEPSDAG